MFRSFSMKQASSRARRLTVIAAAGALLLGAGVLSSAQAPAASAQGYYPYNYFNNYGTSPFGYNGLSGYNSLYGYNGLSGYNSLYGYNGLSGYNSLYGYNGLYGSNYGYNSYPYSNYTYPYSYSGYNNYSSYNPSMYTYPTTSYAPSTSVTVTSPSYTAPTYVSSGSYCNLPDGGQVWVPSGASAASYGC